MLVAAVVYLVVTLLDMMFILIPNPPNLSHLTQTADPELLAEMTIGGAGPTEANPLSIIFSTMGQFNNVLPVDVALWLFVITIGVKGVCFGTSAVRWALRFFPTLNLGAK